MGDEQRIATAERPCHRVPGLGGECAEYLRGRHDERVRVVEGLVATIKALRDAALANARAHARHDAVGSAMWENDAATLAHVLAVVEAAREDTP